MSSKNRSQSKRSISPLIASISIGVLLLIVLGTIISADWHSAIPLETQATYVGRQSCVDCHKQEHDLWEGSHHDLAMDLATDEFVLGNFDDAELEHYGITSKMFKQDDKYLVNTEGPDGKMQDFEVKYVFGVEPLQQYMVELQKPTPETEANALGRVQVLRISWDTAKKEWFYLSPPDVDEKLDPEDPLHWTGSAQNWNHMCADCHSTDLKKNHDLATNTYHTTFSEIDVSCESCHGPGSMHVGLANANSLFWDKNHGYGLKKLKGKDTKNEIETCAACHSRRRVVCPDTFRDEGYYDRFANELLMPDTYHSDGQIMDEDYVYGSFIQSKMFHKGIRCTDCHDPHTTKLKFEGNKLCTSCHQHKPGKYDTPSHHNHKMDGTGASCVECHMPETTYMEVDPRRDHSLRVPRPDLSVDLGTPNACTKCHLDRAKLPDEKRKSLKDYGAWIIAVRNGDEEVKKALAEVDQWAYDSVKKWYGKDLGEKKDHFAYTLRDAWDGDFSSLPKLEKIARTTKDMSSMVRASALYQMGRYPDELTRKTSLSLVEDDDPQVRAAALANLQFIQHDDTMFKAVAPLLKDKSRSVRTEAARILIGYPPGAFNVKTYKADFDAAFEELRDAMMRNSDQAGAHLTLGLMYQEMNDEFEAERSYRNAILVQPNVTGPRANLSRLLEVRNEKGESEMRQLVIAGNKEAAYQMAEKLATRAVEIQRLRDEELGNLGRDVRLLPTAAPLQYRYGLAIYLSGSKAPPEIQKQYAERAEVSMAKAVELDPTNPEFLLGLTLLYQKLQRWDEALATLQRLAQVQPGNPQHQQIFQQMQKERYEAEQKKNSPETNPNPIPLK
ncbi:MAG: tetratricopeptide repeat protein [Pirellulales bacterium]|jgi:predicted CXXCH cytochrome family protein